MAVDLNAVRADLARVTRAARRRGGERSVQPYVSEGLDPLIGAWAKKLVESGELDLAIAEVAASDPDLAS